MERAQLDHNAETSYEDPLDVPGDCLRRNGGEQAVRGAARYTRRRLASLASLSKTGKKRRS